MLCLLFFQLAAYSQSACEKAAAEFVACKEVAEEQHPEAKETLMTCLDEEDAKGKAKYPNPSNDNPKMKECVNAYIAFFKPFCPVEVETMQACGGFSSLKFEDFALDFAEDEEPTAYATHLRG